MSLGFGRKQALQSWRHFQAWLAREASNPRPRTLKVQPWQDFEREFRAFLDEMPRKPTRFLAMVADIERRRGRQQAIAARKAQGRLRYQRRYAARSGES